MITTLRSHLSRLTAELSDHQHLLTELRSLRDTDSRTLAEKGRDVDRLRQEVERLAGEVEVLRGVVEEGLKERRTAREQSEEISHISEDEESQGSIVEHATEPRPTPRMDMTQLSEFSESEEEDESVASSSHRPGTPSPRSQSRIADRTMRTDHATLGSSQLGGGLSTQPFIDNTEMDRISAEMEERRSERSASSLSESQSSRSSKMAVQSRILSRTASPMPSRENSASRSSRRNEDIAEPPICDNRRIASTGSNRTGGHSRPSTPVTEAQRAPSRPTAPTPAAALGSKQGLDEPSQRARSRNQASTAAVPEQTPFPQIRGTRMERLFFSAPEHNAQTCTVCHRRRRRATAGEQHIPFWSTGQAGGRGFRTTVGDANSDDEGFAEGPEDDGRVANPRRGDERKDKGREREQWRDVDRERAPPQTVLARVLRELEDDFTHYKRCAVPHYLVCSFQLTAVPAFMLSSRTSTKTWMRYRML